MTALQEFLVHLFPEISDDQRSILLVEIMNAMGFSTSEREIQRYQIQFYDALLNILSPYEEMKTTLTGSSAEGMRGGLFYVKDNSDYDALFTFRNIKLCNARAHNIINLLPVVQQNIEERHISVFVEEDDNFPGYVKLVELKNIYMHLKHGSMDDDQLYLSNSIILNILNELPILLKDAFPTDLWLSFDACKKADIHGPAHRFDIDNAKCKTTYDNVGCIHFDVWPNSANSFITRRKQNNWPSNSMLENIKSQGCDVAPVGHHDSKNKDIQWRISFPGERSLLLDLTDVQILCYALIKIILKEVLNTSQRDVVGSFHLKHVMFWCVELSSCQWVDSNYINCLNICLTKLIEMIKARHIPHYIIESRNLFNSKMTEQMSKEIVDVLSKYDTRHVFRLDAFKLVFQITLYNNVLLKRTVLTSKIAACFNVLRYSFASYVQRPSIPWHRYIPHNATQSLLIYVNILKKLNKEKGMAFQYVVHLVRSMVGFLYYAKFNESNEADFLLASKRLIHKSLNLESSCVKLRAATFLFSNLEYSKSIEICNTFLTCPPRQTNDSGYSEYVEDCTQKVCQRLCIGNTTEEIENVVKAILPVLYSSVKLKPVPENYDTTQQSPVGIFCNFTNIFVRGLCMDVIFMTAEKWVVPDPILYELLSLPHNEAIEGNQFSGISLDPMFACIQTKFLCYHSLGNVNDMDEMLSLMGSFIPKKTLTTTPSCVYLNIFAYCQIKAGQHRQFVKSILLSLRIFPSRYNAASGYLRIVLQILNSLSV